jgi:glutamyl/glutaminyl-tRNA synthetase
LLLSGCIYPCKYSRKDVERALSAPHEGDEEIIYPIHLRPDYMQTCSHFLSQSSPIITPSDYQKPSIAHLPIDLLSLNAPGPINWRFRVPDDKIIEFHDNRVGKKSYTIGKDFGDFLIWRADGIPSYDFACVVDDLLMNISEIVRGEDLLLSTAKQLLLYYALMIEEENIPEFYHCPLLRDSSGKRLAKRNDSQSLKSLAENGYTPTRIMEEYFNYQE